MVACDSMQDLISSYTSIVGKPRLKPRYALGYHQACYGYEDQESVLESVNEYRKAGIPLDGMYIDVDMHFPDPIGMFKTLREQGVKYSTNITPYISFMPSDTYNTLNEGLKEGHSIMDDRDLDPTAPEAYKQHYQRLNVGKQIFKVPVMQKPDYFEPDTLDFNQTFSNKQPFHGGVFYGWRNGYPGYYPNLNDKEVRRWWGKQYKYLFECGLDFIWQDMTGPCIAEEYGDMKGLPFRLNLDSNGWCQDYSRMDRKRAIEIWSLYSYNLHKATYHGMNNIDEISPQHKWRENRRNFIIGHGSFVGSHRFAGLWTGDNASTWESLDISVAQVLDLGMSGIALNNAGGRGLTRTLARGGFIAMNITRQTHRKERDKG
ncbi:hypothetical protein FSARC_4112 [Fusarium sarcochroum]|uniref:alpha-glucosidase n=1 Tax=Fusarium sarcochroum TaxID=1208366 RepID=A0A8H4U307_9HYPO|nr:hypothetical protein FSARC_4112 [Fusarium sarcochroum]